MDFKQQRGRHSLGVCRSRHKLSPDYPLSDMNLPFATTGFGPPLVVFPGLSRSEIRDAKACRPLTAVTGRTVCVVDRPRNLPRGITISLQTKPSHILVIYV